MFPFFALQQTKPRHGSVSVPLPWNCAACGHYALLSFLNFSFSATKKKPNTTKIRFAKHVLFFKKSLYVYLEKAVAALSYVHFKCCFSCYLLNNFHVGRTSGLGLKCKWLLSAFTPASNDSTVITCVCGNQL